MNSKLYAYTGAAVFDGTTLHEGQTLLVRDDRVTGIVAPDQVPQGAQIVPFEGGILAPGFVDLQVNGGGGVTLNDHPSVETLRRMSAAHAGLGATSILPTLITDTVDKTVAAIAAVKSALAQDVPGILGLHLEGPHLAVARKGAHNPDLIRRMGPDDLDMLCTAAEALPLLKITLAPESVTTEQMRILVRAGAILSLGHTDADFDTCVAAAEAGVTCVTHLFNAMRQLGSRDPGVVGAALTLGSLSAGLIGDLVHVHPQTIRLALAAKQGPGLIFLVSDAMAVAGSDIRSFVLNGRAVTRGSGRLTLEDGTLAGADLDLATAAHNLCGIGVPLADTLAMATSIPAEVIGRGHELGFLAPRVWADFVHLDARLRLCATWRRGVMVEPTLGADHAGPG